MTETDPQTAQPASPPRMQFCISTILLAVLVAATGCMGWKLADWMVSDRRGAIDLAGSLLAVSTLLIVFIAGIGGRLIVLPALIGLIANALLISAIVRMLPRGVGDLFFLLFISNPGALFLASLRFVRVRKYDFDVGIVLLLAGAFLESWLLALAILDVAILV